MRARASDRFDNTMPRARRHCAGRGYGSTRTGSMQRSDHQLHIWLHATGGSMAAWVVVAGAAIGTSSSASGPAHGEFMHGSAECGGEGDGAGAALMSRPAAIVRGAERADKDNGVVGWRYAAATSGLFSLRKSASSR